MPPQHHQLSSNPFLIDRLNCMQQEETLYQVTTDYLLPSWTKVSPSDRRTMGSISYDIVDAFSIDREVSCIAMTYFDRFMATTSRSAKAALMSRREFQLVFIVCLIIALKYRAGMQVDSVVRNTICQGMYNEKELITMEKEILSALQWRLNGPSAHEFISGLLGLMPSIVMRDNTKGVDRLKMLAVRQVEMAMPVYRMAFRNHSSIAYAALLTAMNDMDPNVFHPLDRLTWMKNIDMVMGMKTSDSRVLRDQQDHSMVQKGQIISTIEDSCFDKDKSVVPQREDGQDDLHDCSSASSTASTEETQEDDDFDELYPMSGSFAKPQREDGQDALHCCSSVSSTASTASTEETQEDSDFDSSMTSFDSVSSTASSVQTQEDDDFDKLYPMAGSFAKPKTVDSEWVSIGHGRFEKKECSKQ